MRLKNKIAVLIFITGMGVIGFTLFTNSESETDSDQLEHLDQRNHSFTPDMISKYVELDNSYEALALFVVADEICTSCINEIVEYTEVVTEYIDSPLNRFRTFTHGLIVGDDSTDYKRMNYLIEFPFPSGLVQKNATLAKQFKEWKEDVSGINQMVLVDLRSDEVVGRIEIFTNSTTKHYKRNLVQEAFHELEKQNKSK